MILCIAKIWRTIEEEKQEKRWKTVHILHQNHNRSTQATVA